MPRVQTYQTHRHTPTPTLVTLLLALGALMWFIGAALRNWSLTPGLVLITVAVIVLGWISRGSVTRLQDRIILLEMRTRCRDLVGPERARALDRLHKRQIIALRFAPDEELPALVERAEKESLSGDEIKRSIRNWRADWERT